MGNAMAYSLQGASPEAELAKNSRWGRPARGRRRGAAGEFPAARWGICPTLRDGWLRHWASPGPVLLKKYLQF